MFAKLRPAHAVRAAAAMAACAGVAVAVAVPSHAAPAGPGVGVAAAAAAPVPSGPDHTSHAYFTQVLKRLKLPVTQPNLDALYAVEHREGDNDRYNPLNVIQPEPGSHAYNSIGVQRYASFATGVDGTVHLLGNGHWTGVRAALRHGNSTARVLGAFSSAYTWDSGITFQTARGLLDAEAVRDVGGRYADPALAAQRAARAQAGLRQTVAGLTRTMDRARITSTKAHSDYAAQQLPHTTAAARARSIGRVADRLSARANADHDLVVKAITSEYLTGHGAGSVGELLDSRSPTEYLDTQALQSYVSVGERRMFHHYLAEQKRVDAVTKVVAEERGTATATGKAMTADQRTWAAADRRAAQARARLLDVLRKAQRNSITQPVAVDGLARLRHSKP